MKYFIIILATLFIIPAFSQDKLKRSEYELTPLKGIVFFKELAVEIEVQPNGFSLGVNKGQIARYNLSKYYHFDLGYMDDPRERSKSEYLQGFEGISTYTYAKQNYFFMLRGGIGRKYFFSEKARKRGIAVGYSFEGGANLGLLKPYFLVLEYSNELDRTFRSEAYSEENAELFLNENKIRDKGSFYKGWDQLSIVPGLHINVAAHFSLGAYEKYIKALEVGFNIDAYLNKVPIMVETENHSNRFIFPNFFVNVQFGKRSR